MLGLPGDEGLARCKACSHSSAIDGQGGQAQRGGQDRRQWKSGFPEVAPRVPRAVADPQEHADAASGHQTGGSARPDQNHARTHLKPTHL